MKFTDIQKKAIFKDLAVVSKWQVAKRHNVDTQYKNKATAITVVDRIAKEVMADPEKFAVSQDLIDLVKRSMAERKTRMVATLDQGLVEKPPENVLDDMNVEQLVSRANKKSWIALNKSLDRALRSSNTLSKVPIGTLAKIAGISFDKGQIVKGAATEHIEMKAHISQDMTPADKLELILKMREAVVENEK